MNAAGIARRDAFLAAIRQAPVIMGILNVTPDSFSDGGRHDAPDAAIAHAAAMVEAGAAIVDVGGESTRPGFDPVSEEEELRRTLPVVAALAESLDVPVSIDTYKAVVAREATRLGAVVVNDVWGLQRDPAMPDTVAEAEAAAVVMHNRAEIDGTIDIIDDIRRFFDRSLALAGGAGVPSERIILDPGIGFGKTFEQNLECLRHMDRFLEYGLPLLLGLSRKSFIGRLLDRPVEERLAGTLAANVIGLARGASIIRVHDVVEHRDALALFRALRGSNE